MVTMSLCFAQNKFKVSDWVVNGSRSKIDIFVRQDVTKIINMEISL